MTCEMGCAKTIQKKLAGMEGVKSATVDFKNEMAMVEYDVAKVQPGEHHKCGYFRWENLFCRKYANC